MAKKITEWFKGRKVASIVAAIAAAATVVLPSLSQCAHVDNDDDAASLAVEEAKILASTEESSRNIEHADSSDETDSEDDFTERNEGKDESNVETTSTAIAPEQANTSNGSSVSVNGESSSITQTTQSQNTNQATPSLSTDPERRWVEETEQVWVVDQQSWRESVPTYENVECAICNICGADITGNITAHCKQHMLAGEGSGFHSEVHRVQTGINEIIHDEVGHWKTVVTGGHWE